MQELKPLAVGNAGGFHRYRLNAASFPAVEKTLRQARQQIHTLVGLAQQERAAIGTDRPASKRATISREPHASNPKLDWLHSVMAKAVLFLALNCYVETQLCHESRPFANRAVRNAG
ncbi:MAG: hypothetical protein M3Z09_05295 [Acidobacteriota bacterium]|nr:hypothetical protein [Acidobacteriota bacterium]